MREPTLEEMDVKIQEILIDARKIRQSWFKFRREESQISRIVWYTLYKNDELLVKLALTDRDGKGYFDWVEPPQYEDREIGQIFLDTFNTWLFSLRGWDIDAITKNSQEETIGRKVEFNCSQEDLLETIKNLGAHSRLASYQLDNETKPNPLGFIDLPIRKTRPLLPEELSAGDFSPSSQGAVAFDLIGHIKIGKITKSISTLEIRTENSDLIEFFDLVRSVLDEYKIYQRYTVETSEQIVDKSPTRPEKIESIKYPFAIDNFKARMGRFLALKGNVFPVPNSKWPHGYEIEYFELAETRARAVWNVMSSIYIDRNGKSNGVLYYAMILASAESTTETTVDFIDGKYYALKYGGHMRYAMRGQELPEHLARIVEIKSGSPIGVDFSYLAGMIMDELQSNNQANISLLQESISREPKTRDLNEWFDYYHAVKDKMKISLREISEKANYNHDYVRQQHALYVKGLEKK